LVESSVWGREVAGSSPVIPNYKKIIMKVFIFILFLIPLCLAEPTIISYQQKSIIKEYSFRGSFYSMRLVSFSSCDSWYCEKDIIYPHQEDLYKNNVKELRIKSLKDGWKLLKSLRFYYGNRGL
jgi:hypothetical protein